MDAFAVFEKMMRPQCVEPVQGEGSPFAWIRLHIPDLRNCEYVTWGDWGPMFDVQLNYDYPICIEYKSEPQSQIETFSLHLKTLKIESPMQASQREAFPLFMRIPWSEKGVEVQVFFGPDSEPRVVYRKLSGRLLENT